MEKGFSHAYIYAAAIPPSISPLLIRSKLWNSPSFKLSSGNRVLQVFAKMLSRNRMLIRSLVSSSVPCTRNFSGTAPPPRHVLKTGDTLRQTRIFTNEDVTEYSKASHDSNPLHFDSEFARNAGFEDRLVHGMLVAALFPRIISSHFPGAVYVSQSLHYKSPVYIGDAVVGEVQATNIRENKSRYIVKFLTRCFKNDKLLVIDGEAVAILPNLAAEKVNVVD